MSLKFVFSKNLIRSATCQILVIVMTCRMDVQKLSFLLEKVSLRDIVFVKMFDYIT